MRTHEKSDRQIVWRGLTMALRVPPFLYTWEDRAKIAESLDLLRAAMAALAPGHPAMPEMLTAARTIDAWLARNSAEPEQRAHEPGAREWNEVIAPELSATWTRIAARFD